MSERLYYDDSMTHVFKAQIIEVTEHDGRPAVVLDGTCFYPAGGGQPHDTGTINDVAVIEVMTRKPDMAVLHILATPLEAGRATCRIDWARRFDLMQHHTGQHILSRAFIDVLGANTVGFHLSADTVTVDLDRDAATMTPEDIAAVEDLANRIIHEDRPVTARILTEDQLGDVRMRKQPDALATDGIRVVTVADFDATACGGTHVPHAGMIGLIKVMKVTRLRGGARVDFLCGGRALAAFRAQNALLTDLSNDLSVGWSEVPDAVERLSASYKETASALKVAQSDLSAYRAAELLETAETVGEYRVVQAVIEGLDGSTAGWLASELTGRDPGVIVLVGVPGEKAVVIAGRGADVPLNMNELLTAVLEPLGGRGGGRPEMARGGAVDVDDARLRAAFKAAVASVLE